MPKTPTRKAIEVKIATVVSVVILLHAGDLATVEHALKEITGEQSDYFDHELAVLDVGPLDLEAVSVDWAALIALLKSFHLNPVAVRNAPSSLEAELLGLGLSIDTVSKPRVDATPANATAPEDASHDVASVEETSPAPSLAVEPVSTAGMAAESVPQIVHVPTPAPNTMIVDTPVRAGQRVYARGCDLIVTAAVNNGAEVIADGSIHIYAPLRGRALAGASGNAGARIFALNMEAELVSIAGMYKTFEEGLPKNLAGQSVQVSLTGDRLDMRPIGAHGPNSK